MATTRIRIGPSDQGRPMTLDEFWDAEEAPGYLHELARGALDVTEVPGPDHWEVLRKIHELFSAYNRLHPGVIRLIGHGSEARLLALELRSDRHPDVAVVPADAPRDVKGHPIPGLVVEIPSPGARARRRDHAEKREEYLAIGVREYWIVDPSQRTVMVLPRREAPGGPAWEERTPSGDDRIASGLLPGLDAPVAAPRNVA
jgi:Uma2 family endonuclease